VSASDLVVAALLAGGCFFYLAGTVGLLRFPDVHTRLHALTKADNVGLLLVCLALALQSRSVRVAALLVVVWMLGLLAATVSCHLIARHQCRRAAGEGGG
jgi:multicomponent Na+:H+ antiporter subunit G